MDSDITTSLKLHNTILSDYSYQLSPFNAELLKVSQYLTQAILLEVSTHPKPGLVTRNSNGSHTDMTIFTFMMSSAVLSKAFYELQEIGCAHDGPVKELFFKVRNYGVEVEKELLDVTKGVNTQRGILFAGGILSAAAGFACRQNIETNQILEVVKEMTEGLVEQELRSIKHEPKTYGEKLFREYGITGIRGEVEAGFPCVVNYGLPAMKEAFARGASINDALLYALLNLMTVVEDSNVLWRTNIKIALRVKSIAKDILRAGSVFSNAGRILIEDACKSFELQRISPGGCADLLSITIALYLLENKRFPYAIL